MIIKIIYIGKTKEKWIKEAEDLFLTRLKPYISKVDFIIIKESAHKDINKKIEEESINILSKVDFSDKNILLEIKGKKLDSKDFSELLFSEQPKTVSFIIGGSNGILESTKEHIKKNNGISISFSDLTFTHEMMKIILLEQIYRGCMIKSNKKYHK